MVIDSHIHFGKAISWDMPEQDLIRYIYEYHIDYAILSNVSGVEFDHSMKKIDHVRQYPQIQLNERTAQLVKAYPDKLKGLCWIKPYSEGCTNELRTFLEENKKCFCGMKVHPYYSAMAVTDPRMIPYIELCRALRWSCVVHTAGDAHSLPESVCRVAESYPEVNFIMVHIGTGENYTKAVSVMRQLPNIYGDTTGLEGEDIINMIRLCGSHKVLFGTDAIMQGVHTAEKYIDMIDYLKTYLSVKELEDIFCKNAKRVFNLQLSCKEIKTLL